MNMSATIQTDDKTDDCVPCREEDFNVCQCAKRDVINELVNFHIQNTPDTGCLSIKPSGAFQESPYFIAYIKTYDGHNDYNLVIMCDNIVNDNCYGDFFRIQCMLLSKNEPASSRNLRNAIVEAIDILNQKKNCKAHGKFLQQKEQHLLKQASLSNILH